MALKKALYNADLFFVDNSKPTHRDSRTNSSDIIDYIISSPAIFNKVQNLTLNSDLSSDHSAILFYFSTNFNKSIVLPLKSRYTIKLTGTQLTLLSLNNCLFYRSRFWILYLLKTLILLTSIMQPLFLPSLFWMFTAIFQKKLLRQILAYLSLFNCS